MAPKTICWSGRFERAAERGSYVVAAVGNAGPVATPLYPAAYDDVIGVTAIDERARVFLRASRGRHVDFAAPGVNVLTAQAEGGYATRTGTSMAAPFVTAVLTYARQQEKHVPMRQTLDRLRAAARDLGAPGFDPDIWLWAYSTIIQGIGTGYERK